ncbi:MAG TPA: hypothetical protein VK446_12115 [Methylocystis sp.]|nr:hypothetical protein [Methylocystis sp.]
MMRTSIFGLAGREIARWSEPLVADLVYDSYRRCKQASLEAQLGLARLHCRFWRKLLEGDTPTARQLRSELAAAVTAQELGDDSIDAIDTEVLEELLSVVMRCNQHSRATAEDDGMTLVRAASKLGEMRKAA